MNPDPGSPSDWLRHAKSDLAIARMARTKDVMIEDQCYHAQQCAEKSIKAVLVASGIEPPKTHDLEALLRKMPQSVEIPPKIINAFALTDYASTMRYPGLDVDATENDLAEAVILAEAVLNWAISVIEARP